MSNAAASDAVASFYKSRTVTLLLGFPTGGGYDTYARAVAKHMARHIPGTPSIIVQNMPGAGSLRAANHMFNVAPRDGSIFGMISSSAAFEPLFGNQQAKFDTRKFTWVGNLDESTGTCSVWHTSGINHFDDLFHKEAPFAGAGAGSVSAQHPQALINLLGVKIKLIRGYEGGTDRNLAMQRGEVAGACALSLSALNSAYADDYKSGRLKPILQLGLKKHPELEGVAHIYDYAKTERDRQIIDLIFGRYVLGRPVIAPPALPADRTASLRAAFMATMQDPQFVAEAEKLQLDIAPSSGEEVDKIVTQFFSYPPEIIAAATAAMDH